MITKITIKTPVITTNLKYCIFVDKKIKCFYSFLIVWRASNDVIIVGQDRVEVSNYKSVIVYATESFVREAEDLEEGEAMFGIDKFK